MTSTLNIVCPHCSVTNRVPDSKSADQGQCGNCHEPLFNGAPVQLDTSTFAKHIAGNDIPVLVDFWAPWCGPCKMMGPIFERATEELQPGVRLAKINTEAEQQLATQYGIRSIPTLALFKNGKELARVAGAMDLQNLLRWTRSNLQ